jgi:hypothetical protein
MNIMLFILTFMIMPFIIIYKLFINIIYLPYDVCMIFGIALKSENIYDMTNKMREEVMDKYEKMIK